MDLGLHGRACIVTGGSRGLGRATAQALADDGERLGRRCWVPARRRVRYTVARETVNTSARSAIV